MYQKMSEMSCEFDFSSPNGLKTQKGHFLGQNAPNFRFFEGLICSGRRHTFYPAGLDSVSWSGSGIGSNSTSIGHHQATQIPSHPLRNRKTLQKSLRNEELSSNPSRNAVNCNRSSAFPPMAEFGKNSQFGDARCRHRDLRSGGGAHKALRAENKGLWCRKAHRSV